MVSTGLQFPFIPTVTSKSLVAVGMKEEIKDGSWHVTLNPMPVAFLRI